jgi:hypothetical protein
MAFNYGTFDDANNTGRAATPAATKDSVVRASADPFASLYNARQQGVFSANPLMTPKYAKNTGLRDAEFKDTMARLYVSLADVGPQAIKTYRDTLPDTQTKALADVLLATGKGGSPGTGFIDFFLTSANESFQEVMQVDKVLADDYVAFFYGQSPPIFQYSGVLLNSMQDDFRSGFARAYLELLRGTQLARRGALARLRYDSVIVSGVMTAHQQTLQSDNELAVPFSFSFLVKDYTILSNARFNKLSASQYVQLADQSEVAKLGASGVADDRRVRTVSSTPPVPAGQSAAGVPAVTDVIDTRTNAMVQTITVATSNAQRPRPTSNIQGTVQTPAPTPPAAFATINPAGNFLTTTPNILTVP